MTMQDPFIPRANSPLRAFVRKLNEDWEQQQRERQAERDSALWLEAFIEGATAAFEQMREAKEILKGEN